jgi:hypothetical protein
LARLPADRAPHNADISRPARSLVIGRRSAGKGVPILARNEVTLGLTLKISAISPCRLRE